MSKAAGGVWRSIGLAAVMKTAGFGMRLLRMPEPTLMVGPGSSARLGQAIAGFGHRKLLIVTDRVIRELGLLAGLTGALDEGGAAYEIFDEISPDAPLPEIERGIQRFNTARCDAIVAFGGGSPMDAAKAIAASVANRTHPSRLAGYFRGLRTPVPIYAVPTTAGTGSEVTAAAVISDPVTHKKLVIVDTRIVPKMAALDPSLMLGLPPQVTAATGMDALTHAVEAYLSRWATPPTDRLALTAVAMIFANLRVACRTGGNAAAREQMALASTYAGLAFTRANLGYVHAIAHQLGGQYGTPHGLANAIVLPHVLEFSEPAVTQRLARLAIQAKVGRDDDSSAVLAQKFIDAVRWLSADIGIPRHLDSLREADIPQLAKAACREADSSYPVPLYMAPAGCEDLIRKLLPRAAG